MSIYRDLGGLWKIGDIVGSYNVSRILVVTGKKSFQSSGSMEAIKKHLKGYNLTYFNDFEVNPRLTDAQRGAEMAIENATEAIICIGGGSVLDMGKLIKALYSNPCEAENLAKGMVHVSDPNIPLVAIPTTAGSGSESTHFAAVYIDDMKYSLAHHCLLPDDVILDGNLALSATRYQKACNVLDAISQSIESAWAVGSTTESRDLSFAALDLCLENFTDFVNIESDQRVAQAMLEASNLAGQAINITKTTAAHAWSYSFTKQHNIPHGHAVWLTLPKIFEFHMTCDSSLISDPRGLDHHASVMNRLIGALNISSKDSVVDHFKKMLASIGISADMRADFRISRQNRIELSNQVNQERMRNNPIIFARSHVDQIFQLTR